MPGRRSDQSAFGTLRPRVQIPPSRPSRSWSEPILLSTGPRPSSADHIRRGFQRSPRVHWGLRQRFATPCGLKSVRSTGGPLGSGGAARTPFRGRQDGRHSALWDLRLRSARLPSAETQGRGQGGARESSLWAVPRVGTRRVRDDVLFAPARDCTCGTPERLTVLCGHVGTKTTFRLRHKPTGSCRYRMCLESSTSPDRPALGPAH